MNILPKKRWHVRTKDNIARVRRDEALAAEEERKKQLRIETAEREARTEALRKRAREQYGTHISSQASTKTSEPGSPKSGHDDSKHVNLFYELEKNEVVSDRTNEEHEREKKEEKEAYEKQIGYLTYLGQDTNEITGKVSWYNKPREEILKEKEEVSKKQKIFEDPLEDIRKYLNTDGIKKTRETVKAEKKEVNDVIKRRRSDSESSGWHKKHKKDKKHKKKKKKKHRSSLSESDEVEVVVKKEPSVDIQRLRAERLRREREERRRAEEAIARLNGVTIKKEEVVPEVVQKYNSQFNPHLAKQNYSS